MRVRTAIAIVLLGTATAGAADLPLAPATGGYGIYGERAGMIVIYDTEPGVVVRAWWRNPWRNRHYFPVGADEAPKPVRGGRVPEPAESYDRYWSNQEHFEIIRRRDVRPPNDQPLPHIPLK